MGLLKQMTKKFGIDPETCPNLEPWPLGDPPSTLETLLLSDDWCPVFRTFLQDSELKNGQERSEQSKKLLRAARIVFCDDASHEEGGGGFKETLAKISEEGKEGLEIVFQDFIKQIIKEEKVLNS